MNIQGWFPLGWPGFISFLSNRQFITFMMLLSSVQVLNVSNFLQPNRLQHNSLPCPSPNHRAYSNSCPLHQWCHAAISSSDGPYSHLQFFEHQGLFHWVISSHQVAKVLELELQHQSFQWIFRTDFLNNWLVGSPCSPRDSQECSPTPQFKTINCSCSAFFIVQLSYPYMTTRKTIALTRQTLSAK